MLAKNKKEKTGKKNLKKMEGRGGTKIWSGLANVAWANICVYTGRRSQGKNIARDDHASVYVYEQFLDKEISGDAHSVDRRGSITCGTKSSHRKTKRKKATSISGNKGSLIRPVYCVKALGLDLAYGRKKNARKTGQRNSKYR